MADERVEIKIVDAIDRGISNSLRQIANSALEAATAVELLQTELNRLNVNALTKVANAHAKVTNSAARLTQAQASVTTANLKANESAAKVNLTLQRQATEAGRTAAQQAKVAAATAATSASQQVAAARVAAANQAAAASAARASAAQAAQAASAMRAANAQGNLSASMFRTSEAGKLLASVSASVVRTLAAIVVFGGVRKLLEIDSAFGNLQNRLRLVSNTSAELAANTQRVFDIAARSRAPVEEVATAFQRFDLALRQLGASQEEVFRFTESVTKAVISSGASGDEAANGIRQLTQALNKGKLDGDEFRSIMENIPTVADAIAKRLGVTRGELLKLAPQGKITGQVLRDAIAGAAADIDVAFSKTRITVDQAFTILRNNVLKLKADFEEATNNSNILARSIGFLAENVHALGVAVASILSAGAIPALIKAFTFVRNVVLALAATITSPWIALAVAVAAAVPIVLELTRHSDFLKASLEVAGEAGSTAMSLIADGASVVVDLLRDIFAPAVESLQALWREFGDEVTNILMVMADNALFPVRLMVAGFTAAVRTIIDNWSILPVAFRNFGKLAVNGLIQIIERGINGINRAVNSLIDAANAAGARIGLEPMQRIADVNLADFKMEMERGGATAGKGFVDNFTEAFADTRIKAVFDAIVTRSKILAAKREAEKQAQEAKGRGETSGDPIAQFRETLEKVKKPLSEYKEEMTALNALLKANAISQAEFNNAVRGLDINQNLAKLRADLPGTELQGKQEQIMDEFAKRDALLEQARQAQTISEQEYFALREAAWAQHLQKLNELESDRAAMALANASSTFDSLSSIAKDFAGEQSNIYKGLFVASKAFAIAESLVKIQQGMANALSLPFPANLAAVATVAAQGAAISANLQAVKFADGGPVRGPGGSRSDRIPALLSNGEFVVNAEAARRHRDVLEALNRGNRLRTPGFADGGPVMLPQTPRMFDPFGGVRAGAKPNVTVNVYSVEGVEAKVEKKETGNDLQFEIFLRKVDEDLAAKFSQGRGALTQVIKQTSGRGF